jgi:predicted lipid carrier protein YhbT
MVRTLSKEWVASAAEVLAGDANVQNHPGAACDPSVIVQIAAGDLAYHLVVGPGVRLQIGYHDKPTVTIRQSHAVAANVASGTRSAREAFIAGELRVDGDAEALMVLRPLLDHIDVALAGLRTAP